MIHFAYPNVKLIEQTFLGCGRFVAAEDALGEGYLPAAPRITRRISELQLAASILAPESYDRGKAIYERKDRPDERYQGDSQNLAYLLALISRSETLAYDGLQGDIWCTGTVTILDGKHPFLEAVDLSGFEIKLQAFLSQDNKDPLFIIPAAVIHPSHETLLKESEKQVTVISLNQLQRLPAQDIFRGKTILKVHGNELKELVDVLFASPVTEEIGANPYRGLFAFREEDAEFFFGRERFTDRLVEAVQRHPVVSVIGASGSGKSSVVFAELVPRLRKLPSLRQPFDSAQDDVAQDIVQEGQGVGSPKESVNWLIASFSPGINPFHELAKALEALIEDRQRGRYPLQRISASGQKKSTFEQLIDDIAAPPSVPSDTFIDIKEKIQSLRQEESVLQEIVECLLNSPLEGGRGCRCSSL